MLYVRHWVARPRAPCHACPRHFMAVSEGLSSTVWYDPRTDAPTSPVRHQQQPQQLRSPHGTQLQLQSVSKVAKRAATKNNGATGTCSPPARKAHSNRTRSKQGPSCPRCRTSGSGQPRSPPQQTHTANGPARSGLTSLAITRAANRPAEPPGPTIPTCARRSPSPRTHIPGSRLTLANLLPWLRPRRNQTRPGGWPARPTL